MWGTDTQDWGQYGAIGMFCFAMLSAQLWFMRHLVTVTFPTMMTAFTVELKIERDTRILHHSENKADQQRIYDRIERAETVIANALQATRHRIVNLEMGQNGVAEILKLMKEQLQRLDQDRDRGARRRQPPGAGTES